MRKIFKNILSVALCATLMPVGSIARAAKSDEDGIFLNVMFDNQPTNEIDISGVSVSGGKISVKETGTRNKALYLEQAETNAVVVGACTTGEEKNVTYSLDVKPGTGSKSNLKISLSKTADGKKPIDILTIQDNEIRTRDNKYIGSVRDSFSTIAIKVKDNYLFDVYLRGSCVLSDWKMPSEFDAKSFVITQLPGFASYIDNVRVYKSDKKNRIPTFPKETYNAERLDNILMASKAGDFTFFDNRFPRTDNGGSYQKLTPFPKTNSIVCTRIVDMKNPNRTNYIYMDRFDTSTDCYFDVNCTDFRTLKYQYFKMECDFRVDKLGSTIQFPMIRDSETSSSQVTAYPFQITADGSISFSGGMATKVITEGEENHFLAFFDTKNSVASAWLNGEQIAKDIPILNTLKQITLMRVNLAAGDEGKLWLDNMDITGLIEPIVDGVETKTSILPSEEPVKEFLADKIGYGYYGNILYKNNEKIELENEAIYDKDNVKFYVPAETLSAAFDINLVSESGKISGDYEITGEGEVTGKDGKNFRLFEEVKEQDGVLYVPFEEFGETVMGLHTWTLNTGIIVFADHDLNFKSNEYDFPATRPTNWNNFDYLSNFLNFVHPDKERIRADYIANTGDVTSTQHPRLILNADDFAEHRRHYEAKDDEYYSKIAEVIIKKADSSIGSYAKYTFGDAVRGSFYGFQERFIAWGYAYNLTGDQKYVDAAVEQFRIIEEEMPDFNEAHVLDTGQALRGVAIGFDWLYNGFTEEQRQRYAKLIMKKGLEPLGDGLFGRLPIGSFGMMGGVRFVGRDNINGICNAGVMCGAIAIMEYAPEDCLSYLEQSVRSMEYPLSLLAPDGGWIESPAYWEYMMQSVIWGTSALERALGTSYGLMDTQGAESTIKWALSTFGNTFINPYGDCSVTSDKSFSTFNYFGKRNSDRAALYARKHDIENRGYSQAAYNDVIFYDFSNNDTTGEDMENLPNLVRVNGVEMATIRDTFDFDSSNLFFSTHFGTTSGYHQQNDCGTFVLDMLGERWAFDFGSSNYSLQNFLGYKDWQVYAIRAEGHNVMVINPAGHANGFEQQQGKEAKIIGSDGNKYGGYVYADMSEVYAEASKMTLGYYVGDNMNSLTMRNEYTLESDNEVYWFMQTPANATIVGDTLFLEKNGKSVKLEFLSSADGAWEVGPAQPLETSPQIPEQDPNLGYSRVALKVNAKQGDNYLAVKISPTNVTTKPIENIPIENWSVPSEMQTSEEAVFDTGFEVYSNGIPVEATVVALDGVLPELEIKTNNADTVIEINQAKTVEDQTVIVGWAPNRETCTVKIINYRNVATDVVSTAGYVDLPIMSTAVSSTPEVANHKGNITDYNFHTRWTCMQIGSTAIFDLGEVKDIDAVAVAFWKGDVRNYYYDLYTSTDGENWTPAKVGIISSGESEELEKTDFSPAISARYVKFVGNGNSSEAAASVNSNVLEFRVLKKTN